VASSNAGFNKTTMFYFGSNITAANWIKFELQGNVSNYKDFSGRAGRYNDPMFQVVAFINWLFWMI